MRLPLRYGFTALMLAIGSAAPAAFVINETDSDSANTPSTDFAEFVELKGNPSEAATGLKLVWFNGGGGGGNAVSYREIDLTTTTANAQGYLLVGSPAIAGTQIVFPGNTLQNGEDAVALYGPGAPSFASPGPPSATGLIDFIVYQTSAAGVPDGHAINWNLLTGAGDPPVYDENGNNGGASDSLSRIPNGTGTFIPATPSPGSANVAVKSYSFTNPNSWFRFNQVTAAAGTTRVLTLTNNGEAPLAVNSFALDPASSSVFSILTPPTMTIPGVLGIGQATSMTLQFQDPSPTVNKSYSATINYSTDADSTPSASVVIPAELVRFTQSAAPGAVKINEVCYNPGTTDHNHDGSTAGQSDEFIELYNTTASPIVIQGWESICIDADNTNNRPSAVFPAGATIPANGFATLFTNGTPTGFSPATAYSGGVAARIRNAAPGAYVSISDGITFIDRVAYLQAEDSPDADGYTNMSHTTAAAAGGSVGRRPDGAATFRSFEIADTTLTDRPSPNTTNAATAAGHWSMYE